MMTIIFCSQLLTSRVVFGNSVTAASCDFMTTKYVKWLGSGRTKNKCKKKILLLLLSRRTNGEVFLSSYSLETRTFVRFEIDKNIVKVEK